MSTNNKPKLKILSDEEANELLIKWYNGHFTYIEVAEIINERAEKIVSINSELLEALIQIKSLCGKTYPTNEAIFEITNNAIKKATE